jgi:hypothetical protein
METRTTPARLSQHRQKVEQRLADLRSAIESEVGWAPKAKAWVLPLVAFACGIALAFAVRHRRSGREPED